MYPSIQCRYALAIRATWFQKGFAHGVLTLQLREPVAEYVVSKYEEFVGGAAEVGLWKTV